MKFDVDTLKSWNEKPERNTDWWRPQQGENKIRIVEAPKDSDLPSMYVAYKHFNIGPDKKSYWCPKSTGFKDRNWDAKCPVCDYVSKLYNSEEEEDKKFASSMKASQRIILNIVDLSKPEEGVKLFECSKTLWDIMIRYWGSSKWGNLADAEKGYDFTIVRDGAKSFPNYDKSYAADDATPIQDTKWIDSIKNLKTAIDIKDPDILKTILEGGIEPFIQKTSETTDAPFERPYAKELVKEEIAVTKEEPVPAKEGVVEKPAKKKKKTPPCYGKDYEADSEDCRECGWEDMCVKESEKCASSDTLEDEIMKELNG